MTSLSQLMLKETPYEGVLHGSFPKDEQTLIAFLDGLDYVVEEWLDSMKSYAVTNCEQHAAKLLTQVIICRYSIIDFFQPNDTRNTDFIEVMKAIRVLKQGFMILAKSYANTKILADWYLELPMKVQVSFKHIQTKSREFANPEFIK